MQNKIGVLIIGGSGQVGSNLIKSFSKSEHQLNFQVSATYNKHKTEGLDFLDITDKNSIRKNFEKHKPNIVIQTSALTYVEQCEEDKELANKINVIGIQNVVDLCKEFNSKMVYISTDYVFDGKNGPFSEDDTPNPLNHYGKTKLEAEKIVKTLKNFLVIRSAWINDINSKSKNFVMQVIHSVNTGKVMRVANDQFGHPTLASNLAEIIIELIMLDKNGVYHVAGSSYVSRYNQALEITKAFGLDSSLIKSVTTEELNLKATRPLNVNLNLEKIKSVISQKILSLNEQLDVMKIDFLHKIQIENKD